MEKQTAVEWLVEQMKLDELFNADYFIEQAKEMEKEQIIQAYYQNGWNDNDNEHNAEQYYNQKYKQD